MRFFRFIEIDSQSSTIDIELGMENANRFPVAYGLWEVTQFNGPGKVFVPVDSKSPQSALHGVLDWQLGTYQPKSNLSQYDDLLVVPCDQKNRYKIGIQDTKGWTLSITEVNRKKYGILKAFPVYKGEFCPHRASVEIYDSDEFPYFETEVHSPTTLLQSGESFDFQQSWTLCKFHDDTEIIRYCKHNTPKDI